MNYYRFFGIIYKIAMILTLVGIFLSLIEVKYSIFIFSAGAIPIFFIRLFNSIKGKKENRRLNIIMTISALFLILAICLIYLQRNYWIICVLITSVLDLFVSFRKFKK